MALDKKNKVKYNLKNVHWAVLNVNDDGTVTFEDPIRWPGAVSLSMDPSGDTKKFNADGVVYYTTVANNGYDGDFESALVPDEFRQGILGDTLDDNKVLVENNSVEPKQFALLFEFDGDQKGIRHVLYNCTATRPKIESKTNEEGKEVQTETSTLTAAPLPDGRVKAKTSDATAQAVFDNWFKEVYVGKTEQGAA